MKKETPIEILAKTDVEQLREFLMKEFGKDAKLKQRFSDFINAPERKMALLSKFETDIKNQVKSIIKDSKGRRRCIDYRNAHIFCKDINKLLIEISTKSPTIELRINLQMYILNQFEQITFKGDDEQILALVRVILGDFMLMCKEFDNSREMIFKTCMKYIAEEKHFDIFTNEVEDFVLSLDYEEFDKEVELYVEWMIARINNPQGEFSFRRDFTDYVIWMLNHKIEYGAEDKELIDYAKPYWKDFDIRNFFLERYIGESRWSEAVALLEESMEIDKKNSMVVDYYQQCLKKLYPKVGRKKEYIETISTMIDSSNWLDIKLLDELKSQLTEDEWVVERERLLKKFSSNIYNTAEVLHHEGLMDRLAELILNTKRPNTYLLDNYAKDIDSKLHPVVLELYENGYREELDSCNTRSDYKSLMRKMKEAHSINGGKELTDRLTSEWLQVYSKRSALCDEIMKFRKVNEMPA